MDRDALLKQVTVLGFMLMDLQLFLNTHPDDKEALTMYNNTVDKACKAREQYECAYGPLMPGRKAENHWAWSCCPWPWQEAFNYHSSCAPCADADGWQEPYGEEYL